MNQKRPELSSPSLSWVPRQPPSPVDLGSPSTSGSESGFRGCHLPRGNTGKTGGTAVPRGRRGATPNHAGGQRIRCSGRWGELLRQGSTTKATHHDGSPRTSVAGSADSMYGRNRIWWVMSPISLNLSPSVLNDFHFYFAWFEHPLLLYQMVGLPMLLQFQVFVCLWQRGSVSVVECVWKSLKHDLNDMIYELWDPVESIDIIEKMNESIFVSFGFVIWNCTK